MKTTTMTRGDRVKDVSPRIGGRIGTVIYVFANNGDFQINWGHVVEWYPSVDAQNFVKVGQ